MTEETDLKARFSGYVRKPFSKRELFDELAQFLPRQTAADPANESSVAAPRSGNLRVPAPLKAELRRLLVGEWPAIRDSLAINESKSFAVKLRELSQSWPCPPLESYADALARHAENYSVTDLEKHLFEFSALVERLERDPSA